MNTRDKFQAKQGRVQIGPRIPCDVNRDLDIYCINTRLKKEDVVEMALVQFLADKDLTPVVQLRLEEAIEISCNDPRFTTLKALIERARITTANEHGRSKLMKRLSDEYRRLVREFGMCVEIKMEYEEALLLLEAKAQ